jgi:hypothetical protein
VLFFDFVVKHWILTLVYVLLFANTVYLFYMGIVVKSNWYERLRHHLIDKWSDPLVRITGTILMLLLFVLPVMLSALSIAPVLWVYLRHMDAERVKRWEKEYLERERYRRAEEEERNQENERRAKARKRWLADNKPRLYFRNLLGITAVLRPRDYEAAQKETAISRRNGFWERENILIPVSETFVFVTKKGKELIDSNTGSDSVSKYKTSGWLSQLDDIVEQGGVEMVRADDIFVPWVNESLVSFPEQKEIFKDRAKTGTYYSLVETQAPKELQMI